MPHSQIINGIGCHGKCTIIARKASKEIEILERKYLRETETGKRLLRDEEIAALKNAEIQRFEDKNILTTVGIDRMIDLYGRAYGYLVNLPGDDRNGISNIGECYAPYITGSAVGQMYNSYDLALYPEVIGLGSNNAVRTSNMIALYAPFTSGYQNTYNGKAGGHDRIANSITPGEGFDYNDDNISKYVAYYTSEEINDLDNTIKEVGLFLPVILLGPFRVHTDGLIHFTDGTFDGPQSYNKFWTVLNGFVFFEDNVATKWTYSFGPGSLIKSRYATTQTIAVAKAVFAGPVDFDVGIDTDNVCILAFTPRIDSYAHNAVPVGLFPVPTNATYWGNSTNMTGSNFFVGDMVASRALPIEFVKNQNIALTVIWQIFMEKEA